jgi:hypothetical protein
VGRPVLLGTPILVRCGRWKRPSHKTKQLRKSDQSMPLLEDVAVVVGNAVFIIKLGLFRVSPTPKICLKEKASGQRRMERVGFANKKFYS